MQNTRTNKTKNMVVRFTEADIARLRVAADAAEQEFSTFVRAQLLNVQAPRNARRKSIDRELLGKILSELNHIGCNINQVAHVANRTGFASVFEEAKAERAQLASAVQALLKALE